MLSKIFLFTKNNLANIIFGISAVFYLLLLCRNPFSERTLIPNFDPFPDATYYLAPPLNLLKGYGLNMYREGRYLIPGVAPLYSLSLLPAFLFKADPRMFYLVNVFLSLISLLLFYLIIKKVLIADRDQKTIRLLNYGYLSIILFLYITNFYLSWYPQWAMAENLLLPLFLLGVYLLLSEINFRTVLLSGLIPLSFVATKYANFPLTLIYPCLYIYKICSVKKVKPWLIWFLLIVFSSAVLFIGHDALFKNRYFLKTLRN
jgi:hypothetical protein